MHVVSKKCIKLFIFIISFLGCQNTEDESKVGDSIDNSIDNPILIPLATKTINIPQIIEGISEERSIIIQTPTVVDTSKEYPVVLAFHGRGGTNTSWVNKLKKFTNDGSFIGIYPQGFLKSWNLGTEPSKADDVTFVNLIVEELKKYNNLNFDKMYAIGSSNGSGMVNKLAVETNHFKAIAPIVSQLIESLLPLTENTNPISVYQINGAADDLIPIDGGPKFGHVFLSAENSAKLWATQFNCMATAEIIQLGENTLYIYKNCTNNKEIRYLRVEEGGHNLQWKNTKLFDDIWEFFKRF